MKLKIEDLQHLVDLTDAELSEINGGYAVDVAASTNNNFYLAGLAATLVGLEPVSPSLTQQQLDLGVPPEVVDRGNARANRDGGGVYTFPVTAAKLEG